MPGLMLGVTCLQEAQSFVCLSHLLSSWSLLSLGGRSAEVAPFAQPTSPPAFSCSHTLKAATALHTHQADSYPAAFERTCIQLQALVKAERVQLSLKGHASSSKLS